MKYSKNMLNILARRIFLSGRIRNLIAVTAIALTAVLFTSVTTIGLGTYESVTLSMQLMKGSKSDGDLRNMTAEQFEALSDADFVKEYGLRMPVGFLTNTSRHNIEFDVMDETEAELLFCNPSHGTMPQAANEIVTSDLALKDLGAEPETGETVTIEFTAHGEEYSMEMVVSGWYEATNEQMSMMAAGTAFRDANPDIFRYTYDRDMDIAGTYWSDIIASSTVDLQENMADWSRSQPFPSRLVQPGTFPPPYRLYHGFTNAVRGPLKLRRYRSTAGRNRRRRGLQKHPGRHKCDL